MNNLIVNYHLNSRAFQLSLEEQLHRRLHDSASVPGRQGAGCRLEPR